MGMQPAVLRKGERKLFQSKKAMIQMILLAVGAAMLCYGAWRGEVQIVLSKAVRLCLECVGIG